MGGNKAFLHKLICFGLLLIILSGVVIRVANIDYSELQGDEISALRVVTQDTGLLDFLLSQEKGPGQYVVTLLAVNLLPKTQIELAARILFLAAGLLTIFVAFVLSKALFKDTPKALFAAAIISSSGLLIAFSKIAQYQSYVMLLSLVSVLLAYRSGSTKVSLVALSGACSGVALLFHYDSLSFIIPIFIFLLIRNLKLSLSYLAVVFCVAAPYYFLAGLRPEFYETLRYLFRERIATSNPHAFNQMGTILSLYHPKEFLLFVLVTPLAALLGLALRKQKVVLSKTDLKKTLLNASLEDIWFVISVISYTVLVGFPLTHIYAFFIPAALVMTKILFLLDRRLKVVVGCLSIIGFLSATSFNYQAFVDTNPEYPWSKKNYIFGSMYQGISKKNKVKGVFGFPYKRGWNDAADQIRKLKEAREIKTYYTNEKVEISSFYLEVINSIDLTFSPHSPDIYIFVKKPRSLINTIKVSGVPQVVGDRFSIYLKGSYKLAT